MKSQTRIDCEEAIEKFSLKINSQQFDDNPKILYVGTAGNPGGKFEQANLFEKFSITTFDADPKWSPDIVGDITKTQFENESWDLIICTQVLEHIPNIWDVPKEIHRILKNNGFAILDTPFMYPYHAEPPSFKDYWRLTIDGFEVLFGEQFELVDHHCTKYNTSCLMKKK